MVSSPRNSQVKLDCAGMYERPEINTVFGTTRKACLEILKDAGDDAKPLTKRDANDITEALYTYLMKGHDKDPIPWPEPSAK